MCEQDTMIPTEKKRARWGVVLVGDMRKTGRAAWGPTMYDGEKDRNMPQG